MGAPIGRSAKRLRNFRNVGSIRAAMEKTDKDKSQAPAVQGVAPVLPVSEDRGVPPSADAVNRISNAAPSGWKLAHVPVIELVDDVVGAKAHHDVFIFALDRSQQGPRIQARIAGDPAIQHVQTPTYLPGTAAFDPSSAIKLDFTPKRAGLHEATLEVDVLDAPMQHVSIPIRAWARLPGAKTHAQEVAAEEDARTDARNRDATTAAHKDAEARIARHDGQAVHHHHAGNLDQLGRKREQIEAKMLDLAGKRANGITYASTNIGAFKRVQPVPEQPSLLSSLAWGALDMVTAGVARNVSNFLRGPLETWLTNTVVETSDDPFVGQTTTVTPHSAALVGFIVEGVRGGVKKVGQALLPGKPEPGIDANHAEGNVSIDAKATFISEQTDAVTGDQHQNAARTSRFVHDSLLDLLDVAPKAAFAVMDTMASGLEAAFSTAIEAQRAETFRNWIRYVTQSSVGTSHVRTAEDGTSVTDLERAATLGGTESERTYDGLVDLRIGIDEGHPEKPVEVKSAKMSGVSKTVAKTLGQRALGSARVPVRAVADASARSATSSLSVMRDESGNLAFDDQVTTSPVASSRWLSHKAGIYPGNDAAQREGARVLMEDELMTKVLGDALTTDSET